MLLLIPSTIHFLFENFLLFAEICPLVLVLRFLRVTFIYSSSDSSCSTEGDQILPSVVSDSVSLDVDGSGCIADEAVAASSMFLGGLSLHLNYLIAERVSAPYWQFGTVPIGIFLSNLVSGQLETSLMTSYCHF